MPDAATRQVDVAFLTPLPQPQVPVTQNLAKSDAFVMIQVDSIEIWAIISTAKPEQRHGRKSGGKHSVSPVTPSARNDSLWACKLVR
jgi:hypothetical protein